jgi:hypothetical protein
MSPVELEAFEDWLILELMEIIEIAKEEKDCRLGLGAIRALAKIGDFI